MKLNEIIKWNDTLSFILNVLNKQKLLHQVSLREFYWLIQCGLNMKLTEHHIFWNCKQICWFACLYVLWQRGNDESSLIGMVFIIEFGIVWNSTDRIVFFTQPSPRDNDCPRFWTWGVWGHLNTWTIKWIKMKWLNRYYEP